MLARNIYKLETPSSPKKKCFSNYGPDTVIGTTRSYLHTRAIRKTALEKNCGRTIPCSGDNGDTGII